jgi:hypothetical protein
MADSFASDLELYKEHMMTREHCPDKHQRVYVLNHSEFLARFVPEFLMRAADHQSRGDGDTAP